MRNYGSIRNKRNQKQVLIALQKAYKEMGVEITDQQIEKLFTLSVGFISNLFFENPNMCYRFPHFHVLRSRKKDNLIQIDIKTDREVTNPKEFLNFYLTEGMEKRALNEAIKEYVDNLVEHSIEEEENNSDIIGEINNRKTTVKKKSKGN